MVGYVRQFLLFWLELFNSIFACRETFTKHRTYAVLSSILKYWHGHQIKPESLTFLGYMFFTFNMSWGTVIKIKPGSVILV